METTLLTIAEHLENVYGQAYLDHSKIVRSEENWSDRQKQNFIRLPECIAIIRGAAVEARKLKAAEK